MITQEIIQRPGAAPMFYITDGNKYLATECMNPIWLQYLCREFERQTLVIEEKVV